MVQAVISNTKCLEDLVWSKINANDRKLMILSNPKIILKVFPLSNSDIDAFIDSLQPDNESILLVFTPERYDRIMTYLIVDKDVKLSKYKFMRLFNGVGIVDKTKDIYNIRYTSVSKYIDPAIFKGDNEYLLWFSEVM